MSYKVSLNDRDEGYGLERTEYDPGETVSFYVPVVSDADLQVTTDDVCLRQGEDKQGYYSFLFIMPEHDVTICINYRQSLAPSIAAMGLSAGLGMMQAQQMMGTPDGKFCSNCGRRLLRTDQKYCEFCGEKQ